MKKRIVGFVAPLLMTAMITPAFAATSQFVDIGNSYAKNAIATLSAEGVLNTSVDHFYPTRAITRGEFCIYVAKALKMGEMNPTTSSPFTDITSSDYEWKYVELLREAGVISGISNDTFGPNQTLTRQDMVVILMRAIKYKSGFDLSQHTYTLPFTDSAFISDYAKNAIAAAYAIKLTGGYPDGTFAPTQTVDRQMAAQFIYNLVNSLATNFGK